jgi:drug/metabolite transporter (DMT)-like permease
MHPNSAYFFALSAAILFSGASVIFAKFAASHSSLWMNFWKNIVATVSFVVATAISCWWFQESLGGLLGRPLLYLLASGMLGLAIGDLFLFQAYRRIGSARTIMIFSFSPLFLTLEGYLFFGQSLAWNQGVALLFMMGCAWVISFERFRQDGAWEWRGILYAIIGVVLDNIGVVLSKMAFELSPGSSAFSTNAIRGIGAIVPLVILNLYFREPLLLSFAQISRREKWVVAGAGFMGTFLSLTCWLTALKIGHIGSLAGVGSFNPVAASLWEWILLRKRPTVYLLTALALFLVGFVFLFVGESA